MDNTIIDILIKIKGGQNHRITKDDGDAIDLLCKLKNIGVLNKVNGVYVLADINKTKDINKLIELQDFSKYLKWSHKKSLVISMLKLLSENPFLSGVLLFVFTAAVTLIYRYYFS